MEAGRDGEKEGQRRGPGAQERRAEWEQGKHKRRERIFPTADGFVVGA